MEAAFVRLENIIKNYPQIKAVCDVSIDFYPGEIHAVLGENGAGKTTLMNIMNGLVQKDSGRIWVNGQEMQNYDTKMARAYKIAMVHQHFALVPEMTVLENILMASGSNGTFFIHKKEACHQIKMLSAEYGLDINPLVKVGLLSPGEKQKAEILKALFDQCRMLILDEPTAVLTETESQNLFRVLRQLADQKTAIVIISHKLDEIISGCDCMTVMHQGSVAGVSRNQEMTREKILTLMTGNNITNHVNLKKPMITAGMSGDPPIIAVDHLTVMDGRGDSKVDQVTFEIHKGEILGIAGVAGNGQSALIHGIMGLCKIEQGRVYISGEDTTGTHPQSLSGRSVGYIPEDCQETGIVKPMTLEENLVLNTYREDSYGNGISMNWAAARKASVKMICDTDIRSSSGKQIAGTLSGGNQQKLVIARELGKKPELLIAVNPARGLDAIAAGRIRQQFCKASADGCAVLLLSADVDEILALSDQVSVMHEGRLIKISDSNGSAGEEYLREKIAEVMAVKYV